MFASNTVEKFQRNKNKNNDDFSGKRNRKDKKPNRRKGREDKRNFEF